MSKKSILLICVLFYSKEIVNSNIIGSIVENFRGLLEEVSNVTRVRTTMELHKEGNELTTLDFIGLVQQYDGYEAEEYDVQTEDGYILKLHRINSSPHSPKEPNKSVVFMQHGFIGSSDQFVNLGPSHDLAYMLADAGYDIWFGNIRGNCYSRRHVKYLPTASNYDFWKFSIDELSAIDAPAMIDNVLEITNKKNLIYIGYSMGTTMSYMLLSTKPEYNDKIDLSISIAPAAYFAEPFTLFFKFLITIRPFLLTITNALQIYELFPLSKFIVAIAKTVCTDSIGQVFCALITNPLISFTNVYFGNMSSINTVLFNGASPDTTSHLVQLAETKNFTKFDFGPRLNQEKYNSSAPPEYDLSKISVPQGLFYADRDTFIYPTGATKTKNLMKNVVSFEKVPEVYKHFDFLFAKNARTDYYYKILDLVKKFS